ncbi:MAG TPA: nucleoside/nucleotide kinase family protein [Jatrophihabitans sp.]|nr:nucleoside/nucleotide kinase family protein [Jatrophihabitans sp.]
MTGPVREFAELLARARLLLPAPVTEEQAHSRAHRPGLLGIAGPPGAGKSRLAARLAAELGPSVALLGMDGFHIADAELRRLGLRDRKGAPETFDRAGYVALLRRLGTEPGVVYAPVFDRAREDSIAAALGIPPSTRLVITEGNYLLYWPEVRPLLDEVWYLDPDPGRRQAALIARHVAFGKSTDEARSWVADSDERNAGLIAAGRGRADLLVDWGDW